jgi:hypothetical protein
MSHNNNRIYQKIIIMLFIFHADMKRTWKDEKRNIYDKFVLQMMMRN